MKIIIDSREQTPYTFTGYPVEVVTGTLATGDYSLYGFDRPQGGIAIERKEINDLIGVLTRDRERFLRELDRLYAFQSAVLVVEAPLSFIRTNRYRSGADPAAMEQSIISIMAKYRLPVYFARDKRDAEKFVYDFLRHFQRQAKERYRALTVGTAANGGAGKIEQRRGTCQ